MKNQITSKEMTIYYQATILRNLRSEWQKKGKKGLNDDDDDFFTKKSAPKQVNYGKAVVSGTAMNKKPVPNPGNKPGPIPSKIDPGKPKFSAPPPRNDMDDMSNLKADTPKDKKLKN